MRSMKKTIPGLGIIIASLFFAGASPALAAPRWQKCTKSVSGIEGCLKVGEGNLESTEITETEEVTSSSANLELEDEEAPGGGIAIQCQESDAGEVNAGGKDWVGTISFNDCKYAKSGECEESVEPRITAVHLPWVTKLEEPEKGIVRDKVESGGKGEPGYLAECTVAKVLKITDECTGATSTKVVNNETKGIVEVEHESKSGKDSCSVSKTNSGNIRGTEDIKARRINFQWSLTKTVTGSKTKILEANENREIEKGSIAVEGSIEIEGVAKTESFKIKCNTVEGQEPGGQKELIIGGQAGTMTLGLAFTGCEVKEPAKCTVKPIDTAPLIGEIAEEIAAPLFENVIAFVPKAQPFFAIEFGNIAECKGLKNAKLKIEGSVLAVIPRGEKLAQHLKFEPANRLELGFYNNNTKMREVKLAGLVFFEGERRNLIRLKGEIVMNLTGATEIFGAK
jgi:hypothetical protein